MSLCRCLEAKQAKQTFAVITIRVFSLENNSNGITVNLWLILVTNIDKIVPFRGIMYSVDRTSYGR